MRRFDLNLLYTLQALLKEPNTTKVGEKLGLTQSAVSASLNRLRWAFRDELLVRSGRAMALTKRGEKLRAPVDEILDLIEKLVEEVRFEPAKLERTFRITSAEFVLAQILPPVLERMRVEAPGVVIKCETASAETRARIRSGHVDVILAPLSAIQERGIQVSHKLLYYDRLVCVASRNNRAFGAQITADEYLAAKHAVFSPDPSKADTVTAAQKLIKDLGLKLNVACEVTSYAILPDAIANTDLIATIPSRILSLFPSQRDFRVMDFPFDAPEFEVSMIWNSTFDKDAEHQWFREVIEEQFT